MNSSQSLGLVVCMPGPQGGTSYGVHARSTNSGVTRISNSTSLTVSLTFRNAAPEVGHVADPGQAAVSRFDARFHQPGDGQRLAGHHFHRRVDVSRRECRAPWSR